MMCCVNKAMPILFIGGKCYTKQLRAGKSHKAYLTNHIIMIYITPLVINALESEETHTHRHTYTYRLINQSNFKKPGMRWSAAHAHLV